MSEKYGYFCIQMNIVFFYAFRYYICLYILQNTRKKP